MKGEKGSATIFKNNFYMQKIKILLFIILVLFGVFMFVYGEYDDSPGGQALGLLAVIGGIVGVVRSWKKNSR
ncbi:MAG: hypothetical protein WC870_02075 [Candidatus Paceibacterota bacterium]